MPFIHADVLREAIPYLFPEISRGPASDHWISTMKALGAELQLEACEHCADDSDPDNICLVCKGTCYDWERE